MSNTDTSTGQIFSPNGIFSVLQLSRSIRYGSGFEFQFNIAQIVTCKRLNEVRQQPTTEFSFVFYAS